MHSSRMRTARSLTVSRHIPYMPPAATHAPPQPYMPPSPNHTQPPSNLACATGVTEYFDPP